MNNISKPILFFGTEDFSAVALSALIEARYDIRAVITKPDSKKGRGQKLNQPRVKSIAAEHGIGVWQPTKLSDIFPDIQALGDVAGVLVSYGRIVPQSIIDLFSPGIVNVHPSLLPHYRGPSPIESAILNGDQKTGVSIMKLSAAMDAGPVYSQKEVELFGDETKPELYSRLASVGATELTAALPDILAGSLGAVAQNESTVTYCSLLSKNDSLLDPSKLTALEAERQVRAYLGFPRSKLEVNGQTIIVTKAHLADQQETPLDAAFSDGNYLSVDELIAPSGKTMTAEAYLRGYKNNQDF